MTESGLFCPAGGFHIDPWQGVECAIVTHGHSDHARWGSRRYITAEDGIELVAKRVNGRIVRERAMGGPSSGVDGTAGGRARPTVEGRGYGEVFSMRGAEVSLHPAGHCLGSCQVRVEVAGEVWVVSGDYKSQPDPTCRPFEPVRCDVFISECTFGLPIFRWRPESEVFGEMNAWWRENAAAGRVSVVFAYALGKAQRVLAGVDRTIGPIFVHGAVRPFHRIYRARGVDLPEVRPAMEFSRRDASHAGALVVGPPGAEGSGWLKRFGSDASTAFASGWMQLRGTRRRRNVERGFVLSDHDDWPGLLNAIESTGASRVLLTHGTTQPLARYLREVRRIDAEAIATRFEGEPHEDRSEAASIEAS